MARLTTSALFAMTLGALAILQGCASHQAQQTFPSPETASEALVSSLEPRNDEDIKRILGPDSGPLISSGDDVADTNAMTHFADAYTRQHMFLPETGDVRTLLVGDDLWPFPIPLVEGKDGQWYFDTPAGEQELLDRRVGANELNAIETCLACADAQLDYAMMDPNGDGIREYARKFISDPGQKNGLYWEVSETEVESPLGPLAAQASDAGYKIDRSKGPRPYYGYYYSILMEQGPEAKDGARDYVIDDMMIGGFAIVARPAKYGNSGVMTFIINQDGIVYQKDLGSNTESRVKSMKAFNPDSSWTQVNQAPFMGPEDSGN